MEEIMMKRSLSLLLVLVLVLSMLPVTAGAVSDGLNILDGPRTYATYYEVEYNGSMAAADRIDPNDAYVYGEVGSVSQNDVYDYFVFTLNSPQYFDFFAIAGTYRENSTYFSLYDADGDFIDTADYIGITDSYDDMYEMQWYLGAGTYYIRVRDPYNWVEYGFSIDLTPLISAPKISVTNQNTDGKPKVTWSSVSRASYYEVYRATSKSGSYSYIGYTYDTSYVDTSASVGTTYYYKVCAISGDYYYEDSLYSNIVSRTCDLPRPTNVKDTRSASTGKVTVSWDPVPGADKYSVYYSTDGGSNYSLLKTVTGTSLTHGSAPVGKTIYYKVKAVYSADTAANSAYSSYTKATATLPAPSISVSNVASTGKIKISWDAISGAAKYTVYIYDANGNLLKSSSTTGTSLTHSSAVAGVNYTYKVKAIGSVSAANSSYSSAKSRTCDLAAPKMSLTNTAEGKIKLSWNKVTGADKYDVYYSTDGTSWSKLKTVTGTSLTHSSATAGKTYYYRVRAVYSANSSANSAWSGSVSGKAISVLAAPSLSLTNTSEGKIKLTWTSVSGADKYSVYYSTDGSSYSLLKTVTGTSLTHSSATAGKTYYYKVMAVDADNSASNSGYSNVVTGEVIVSEESGLAAPSLTVVENSAGKPKLTWTKVTDATKYKVYYSTDDGITWTLLKTMTGSSLTHSSALEGLTYSYKVAAANDSATSPYSNVVSITSK